MTSATETTSHPHVSVSQVTAPPSTRSALLVAATGGHLTELHRLLPRLDSIDAEQVRWATFQTGQSATMLAGEYVDYVRLTDPRDIGNVLRNLRPAWRILRSGQIKRVVSTGSAVALSFIPIARLLGIQCDFVESAARPHGPSMTGRLLARVPGVTCYTQCREWASDRWIYRGSLFDGFEPAPKVAPTGDRIRVVVTLGTMPHHFTALLERLVPLLEDDPRYEVEWQLGTTRAARMPKHWHATVPLDTLTDWMARADLVIAHAGLGSTLDALDQGRAPLLVPREHARGEHVDDHQLDMAAVISDSQIATVVRTHELSASVIEAAVGGRVTCDERRASAPFQLDPPR